MADKLAHGQLEATLLRLKADGLSYSAIASHLYAEHGIVVTPPTVGAWLRATMPQDAGTAA
jgi:intein-encoded DNA endonuclease-like protein